MTPDVAGGPRPELLERAVAWARTDPDPETSVELLGLLARAREGDTAATADLEDRFQGPLEFGTAGLRGALGAGPHRMNRAVVIRAAAGLAAHLLERAASGPTPRIAPGVVIGYDARHGSHRFALDTAAVMTGAGVHAMLLPRALPTPVLASAVRRLDADAGVMVTASHNPPQDNGYKVYLGGADQGSQIVAPDDARIAAQIAAVGHLAGVPRPDAGWEVLDESVVERYLDDAAAVAGPAGASAGRGDGAHADGESADGGRADDRRAQLDVVVTPMHGVGGAVLVEALARAGFTATTVVAAQAEPDPDFPTVAFPNPEEPGAMDLALALARERGADLVLAVDPDADRCAVAVHDPAAEAAGAPDGGWRVLTGDEVGAVLGEVVARREEAAGGSGVLASSIVSSRLLARIAAQHGLTHTSTLTGFKWISRAPGLVYGYEEAIGYCVAPAAVRDKDGISAAVLVAAVAADLAAHGRGLLDLLDALAVAHGLHATSQLSLRVADLSRITHAMTRLRQSGPRVLGGSPVVEVVDLADGPVAGGSTAGLPATDGLLYRTADDARVIIRPSGTEPKLKAYLEVVVGVAEGDVRRGRARAADLLDALRDDVRDAIGL